MSDRRVYIEIGGVRTYIDDGAPLEVVDIANLGASEATRVTERSPAQDGDTDIDRRLEPRIIPIVIQARPDDVAYTYEDARALINRLFKGSRTKIVLGIEFDNGARYHIDTQSVGGVELPFNLLATRYMKTGVRLRAANPTFYDPDLKSQSFGLAGGGSAFTVPTVVPTFFGAGTIDQTVTIEYDGTYKDFPVIQVYGPITDPIIRNLTTGGILDFTGYTVAGGDVWTIDLRFGRKQVYRNGDPLDSQLYKLTNASTIATFAIEADPDVPNGTNVIRVTGSSVTAVTQVYVQYYRRFDGI